MWRNKTVLVLFAIFLAHFAAGQDYYYDDSSFDVCSSSFLCTEDFCSSCPPSCNKPDGTECDGIIVPLHDAIDDFCACCSYSCIQFLEEGDQCDLNTNGKYPKEMCGPELTCRPSDGGFTQCQRMLTSCEEELQDYESALAAGTLGMNMAAPVCDDEGFYSPVQCYRQGACRCVEKETGMPIFGFAGGESESNQDEQDCLCARNYYEALQQACKMTVPYYGFDFKDDYMSELESCLAKALSSSALDNVFFPSHMRCLTNGNFDRLQCVSGYIVEDMCFCVEQETLALNSTRAYVSSVEFLDCFDEDVHETTYFRPCESLVRTLREMESEFSSMDRLFFPSWVPSCAPDGNFGKVQRDREDYAVKYCSDREGEQIEDFRMRGDGSDAYEKMDCECAFAREYLGDGVARPTCCDNGNYRGVQCQSGWCYCVDQWGRQIEQEVDQLDVSTLSCQDWCYEE